jgi:hypothetical protein
MKRAAWVGLVAWLMVASLWSPRASAQQEKSVAGPSLKVGDMAPDFKMAYFDGTDLKDVSLSDYRGKKNVVLAFYIFAFTGG